MPWFKTLGFRGFKTPGFKTLGFRGLIVALTRSTAVAAEGMGSDWKFGSLAEMVE